MITAEIEREINKVVAYRNGYSIAELDLDSGVFKTHESMTKVQAEECYSLMFEKSKEEQDNWDVRAEQGLYGYGY